MIIHETGINRIGEEIDANRENANQSAGRRLRQDVAEVAALEPFFRRLEREEESAAADRNNLPNVHILGVKGISESLIGGPADEQEDQGRQDREDGLGQEEGRGALQVVDDPAAFGDNIRKFAEIIIQADDVSHVAGR